MKIFNNTNCDSDYVKKVKNEYNRMKDNHSVQVTYTNLLDDTQKAINNIDEVIGNEKILQKILYGLKKGDTSSLDTVLGTTERGGNRSHYRSYLALDKESIIEIRISTHYETKNALLNKTNNKSQFLFQVVLCNAASQPKDKNAITNTTSVGNTKVLSKTILSSDTSISDIEHLLKSIHDYLYFPDYSYQIEQGNQTINVSMKVESIDYDNIINKVILEYISPKCVVTENKRRKALNKALRSLFYGPERNGWDAAFYVDNDITLEPREWIGLYKSFKAYAREEKGKHGTPSMLGFKLWKDDLDRLCCRIGVRSLYPNYFIIFPEG